MTSKESGCQYLKKNDLIDGVELFQETNKQIMNFGVMLQKLSYLM